ncbi:MAG: YjgP/YjgQ family permease [Candidatus Omnitrophica bacterium COP1]|nr:YjgP/YjgQ family permease [Candidatus Omnitrophica bacterium COP1]
MNVEATSYPLPKKRSYPWPQVLHTWILNRYLISELLPPLSMGLFLFSMALMLISIRDVLDVILLSGAPLLPIFKTLLCLFPPLLTVSLPIGCLLASMMVYGRLAEDRELTAMRAAGVSTMTLVIPSLFLGVCLTGLNLLWTSNVTPRALEIMKQARWEIVQKMTSISWLKPGQFTALQDDLAFYFTGASPGTNTIHDITIFKSSVSAGPSFFGDGGTSQEAANWTVSAPTASLNPDPSKGILKIILLNCISENLSPEKLSRVLVQEATISIDIGGRLAKMLSTFSREQKTWSDFRAEAEEARKRYEDLRFHLGFPEGTPHAEVVAEARRWMPIEEKTPGSCPLAGGMYDLHSVRASLDNYQVNTNRAQLRLAYPVATFLFMMIGTGLGLLTGRGNRTVSILITVGVLLFYYSVQKMAEGFSENLAMTRFFDPGYTVWAPNIILFLLGLVLLAVVSRH